MALPRIDSVDLQVDLNPDGTWSLVLRMFDARRCKWDQVDAWSGVETSPAASWSEAHCVFVEMAEALLGKWSHASALPFP